MCQLFLNQGDDMSNVVETINGKIHKRDEDFRIYTYDNGFLIEVGGRNEDDDWVTAKVFATSIDEVQEAVAHILTNIPVNS
jgi:hypothetical protein